MHPRFVRSPAWSTGIVAGLLTFSGVERAAPTGLQEIKHVVVLCLENRSFDHYYGCLAGVRGFADRNALPLAGGNTVFYQPYSNSYVLPYLSPTECVNDLGHGWYDGHMAWNNGKWDQWASAKGPPCMLYFDRATLAFYYALAEAYTICDAYHCSVFGPTQPNRMYLFTGTIDPNGTSGGPAVDNSAPTNGFSWTTYPERLQSHGITWKVYQQDYWLGNPLTAFAQYRQAQPGNPLYDRGIAPVADVLSAFQADVRSGALPQVSWLVPSYGASEHPVVAPSAGEFFVKQIIDTLLANPEMYRSTVLFVTYDENDGFFDHVAPPVPAPGTPDEFVGAWPIGLGVRVPMLIVSPWTVGGSVCSEVFDHTSVLRFLEVWTGVPEPNISAWRRRICGDLTSAFDFAHPNTNAPVLPAVTPVGCVFGTTVPVPTPQTFPVQEPGARPARAVPYQPNAASVVDCPAGWLRIQMTNSGCAAVHYAIYANAYRTDGPWQYDVEPNGSIAPGFDVLTTSGGTYDFTCFGPDGFQRRFAGNLADNCGQLEVTSVYGSVPFELSLIMTNGGASAATFVVSNGYPTASTPWVYIVPPGGTAVDTYSMADNNGAYDLTLTADVAPGFLRRFAGRVDATPLQPFVEGALPSLSARVMGNNLVLTHSVSAARGYLMEWCSNLTENAWSPLAISPIEYCDRAVLGVPITSPAAYFRLRRQ